MSDYGQRSEDRNQGYGRGDRAGRGGGPRDYHDRTRGPVPRLPMTCIIQRTQTPPE